MVVINKLARKPIISLRIIMSIISISDFVIAPPTSLNMKNPAMVIIENRDRRIMITISRSNKGLLNYCMKLAHAHVVAVNNLINAIIDIKIFIFSCSTDLAPLRQHPSDEFLYMDLS